MNPILRLDCVSKSFGGVVAAEDIVLSVFPGQIHGLIGPNGAGKSTLMNIISGIYTADKGKIYFDEKDITASPAYQRACMGIGRTFQSPRFLQRSSIRDNLLLGSDRANGFSYLESYFGKKGFDFEMELKELLEIAEISFQWDEDIAGLPYGEKKLLEIIRTMLTHPKVMLVDEPAAGLNQREIEKAMALLRVAAKQRNIGVLLIEHSMDMIMDICENIIVINFGKEIMTGTPREVAVNPEVIEAYLGRDY